MLNSDTENMLKLLVEAPEKREKMFCLFCGASDVYVNGRTAEKCRLPSEVVGWGWG